MKRVERSELLDLAAYEEIREPFRRRIVELKRSRRVAIGSNMTLLFENKDTVLLQIQEMLRTERITKESAILHELETYNELVPGDAELSATAFLEYPDKQERDRRLVELAGIEDRFYVEAGGERCRAPGEPRGERPNRTTAVHYLKFPLRAAALATIRERRGPVTVGVEHAALSAEGELSAETLRSLAGDFEG